MAIIARSAKNPLNIARSLGITRAKPIGSMRRNELNADEAEQQNRSGDFHRTLQGFTPSQFVELNWSRYCHIVCVSPAAAAGLDRFSIIGLLSLVAFNASNLLRSATVEDCNR